MNERIIARIRDNLHDARKYHTACVVTKKELMREYWQGKIVAYEHVLIMFEQEKKDAQR